MNRNNQDWHWLCYQDKKNKPTVDILSHLNIDDNQTRSRCEQRGGLPSDFGATRVNDGRMYWNFDSEFEAIY